MKRLSDYENEDAIELWADLLDPIGVILQDKEIAKIIRSGKAPVTIAKEILKCHKKEATEILLRIDSTPLNGLNLIVRLVNVLMELLNSSEAKGFFGFAETVMDSASSGNATESTEGAEV